MFPPLDDYRIVGQATVGHSWGIPQAINNDRISETPVLVRKKIFQRTGVYMLTTMAYQAQTDGQSERTNQTVEIALRYYVAEPRTDNFPAVQHLKAALESHNAVADVSRL